MNEINNIFNLDKETLMKYVNIHKNSKDSKMRELAQRIEDYVNTL